MIGKWLNRNNKNANLIINFSLVVATFLLYKIASSQSTDIVKQFEIANRPNLSIGRIEYHYDTSNAGKPLTPKSARSLNIFIYNLSNHPVHVYRIKYKTIFEITQSNIDLLINEMKSSLEVHNFNQYFGTGSETFIPIAAFDSTITKEDSIKMQIGKCTLYLELEYYNDVSICWRTYISVVTLADKKSRQTLLDSVYYNENNDTTLERKIPNNKNNRLIKLWR